MRGNLCKTGRKNLYYLDSTSMGKRAYKDSLRNSIIRMDYQEQTCTQYSSSQLRIKHKKDRTDSRHSDGSNTHLDNFKGRLHSMNCWCTSCMGRSKRCSCLLCYCNCHSLQHIHRKDIMNTQVLSSKDSNPNKHQQN